MQKGVQFQSVPNSRFSIFFGIRSDSWRSSWMMRGKRWWSRVKFRAKGKAFKIFRTIFAHNICVFCKSVFFARQSTRANPKILWCFKNRGNSRLKIVGFVPCVCEEKYKTQNGTFPQSAKLFFLVTFFMNIHKCVPVISPWSSTLLSTWSSTVFSTLPSETVSFNY